MIEIEKKFILDAAAKKRLLEGAKFIGEQTFSDTYYDDSSYSLTLSDKWLRARDGKFHLKVSFPGRAPEAVHQYRELTSEAEIQKDLGLPTGESIEGALKEAGYLPIATFSTVRTSYKIESLNIDLDEADLGGFKYRLGEIELMVHQPSEAQAASTKIIDFAKARGLESKPVRSKFITYLQKHIPAHYQALVDSGVIQAA